MSLDWNSLIDSSQLDAQAIKEKLPLEYVVLQSGVELVREDDRLKGLCPFHDDQNPSFAVWAQETTAGTVIDRCGCWVCDFKTGDVYDYIRRWQSVGFTDAVKIAFQLLQQFDAEENWVPSPLETSSNVNEIDYLAVTREAFEASKYNANAINAFIQQKKLNIPTDWLREEFRIGVLDEMTLVIPHIANGEVTGYKKREGARHPYAAPGSKLTELYGAWRDTGKKKVLLTEGESDTWCAAWEFKGEYDVLGLPSGANQQPREEWIARLADRDVTICFDGDNAGRDAARMWWHELHGHAAVIRVAGMDDERDVCTTHNLHEIIKEAMVRNDLTSQVGPDLAGGRYYVRQSPGGAQAVSDWLFYPTRFLMTPERDEFAFEGVLSNGAVVILTPADFGSEGSLKKWCANQGLSWRGSSRDAQDLLNYLMHEAPFLPRGKMTHTAGWHEGHIVLPDLCLGPRHWRYVPPPADVGLAAKVSVEPGYWDHEALFALLGMHQPEIMTPLLAWVCAAPLRGMVKRFPLIALVGGAGLGKTTIAEEVLGAFGWRVNSTLTATTPHAIQSLVASSNGVPVWIDEYRRGARRDTKEAFEQIMRDAWDGSASMKGGMIEANKQILVERPATAPILITGEDVFAETSHMERMALLNIPHAGRDKFALSKVRNSDLGGLGYAYLSWIVKSYWNDTLIAIEEPPLADRLAWVESVLRWGWSLFTNFIQDVLGVDLEVDLNLTYVHKSFDEIKTANPIIDAIIWGHDEADRDMRSLCWQHQGKTYVRVRQLLTEFRKIDGPPMPGGERAVTNWLVEKFRGEIERTKFGRAIVFDTPPEIAEALVTKDEGESKVDGGIEHKQEVHY